MSLLNGSPTWMYNAGGNFYPYLLNQSLRFNAADSAYLNRTPSSTTNRQTSTWSGWVKRTEIQKSGKNDYVFYVGDASSIDHSLYFYGGTGAVSDQLVWEIYDGNSYYIRSSAKFRDASSWYHIVAVMDTTNSTAADRMRLYVNGERITSLAASANPTQNYNGYINNSSHVHYIGRRGNNYLDGYIAEVNFVDGTAYDPTSFGETKEGIWIPKEYTGSHGTNGFYCKFVSGAIGTDSSGNGNNFTHTPGNTSRNRPTPDTPTNNFCLIPTTNNQSLLAKEHQGMRLNTTRTGYWDGAYGSFAVKSGKWYYEVQMNETASDNFRVIAGWKQAPDEASKVFNRLGSSSDPFGTGTGDLGNTGHYAYQSWNTQYYGNGGYTGTSISATRGDVINVAVDFDNNKIYFGKNGTYIANDGGTDGDPANGTNESLSGLLNNGKFYSPSVCLRNDSSAGSNSARFNFGHDRSFGANLSLGTAYADENGFGEFRYTVPSGFLALCSQNLPDPEVDPNAANAKNPTDYFNIKLWTGNGVNGVPITGLGFSPDLIWTKRRGNDNDNWYAFDSVRVSSGVNQRLFFPSTAAEDGNFGSINSFDADGFTLGNNVGTNQSGKTFVGWSWKAGGSPVTNTNGTLTSQVSANTDAGISIVTYSGSNSGGSFGHGLNQAPDYVIIKQRNDTGFWTVGADINGWTWSSDYLILNTTAAKATNGGSTIFTSAPTSTVVNIGGGSVTSTSGKNLVAYCFHNVDGFQKTGIYYGNANTDGPEIRCGFRPAFILIKNTADAEFWTLIDNKRLGYNETNSILSTNSVTTEYAAGAGGFDILSNGFKVRGTSNNFNGSGDAHVYIAFADQPMKYVNAR